ncbi:MAG TPA: imidazoleglycerol-phosphate dehydratase HisB [Deltaproteobacteria bacterium]|nr:imidazoleglycerol-phosphate dehydratase HisB [Deltaproteobacteria bacterium]
MKKREATVTRKTKETDISVSVSLDGGQSLIDIQSGFLTHMFESLVRHSGIALSLRARGDVQVDLHHTVEDIGIVLGQALGQAAGDKKGIERYGWAKIPMDESLVEVVLDLSGRPYFQIHGKNVFRGVVGDLPLELVPEFFRSLAIHAGITLHMEVHASGNTHHLVEACFKSFARALRDALVVTGVDIPSTKDIL